MFDTLRPQPAQPAQVAQPPGERNGSDKPTDPFLKEVQSFMDRLRLNLRADFTIKKLN